MKSKKNIDQVFRERFNEAAVPPPVDAWRNIASQLPQKRKRGFFLPVWLRAAAVAVVILSAGSLLLLSDDTSKGSFLADLEYDFVMPHEAYKDFDKQMVMISEQLETLMKISPYMETNIPDVNTRSSQIFQLPLHLHSRERFYKNSQIKMRELMPDTERTDLSLTSSLMANKQIEEVEQENLELPKNKPERVSKVEIATSVAPIYLSSSHTEEGGSGSMSYGLSVAYAVSDKIRLRTGIQQMNLTYSSPSYSGFSSVQMVVPKNNPEAMVIATPEFGKAEQNLQFIEIPVEIQYSLIDKRINVDLIGGGSFFVLGEVPVNESPAGLMRTTETRNFNNLNLTTNLGLGLGYELSRNLEVTVEPLFKLQLNKFERSTSISPYYFGLYSGLSYRF